MFLAISFEIDTSKRGVLPRIWTPDLLHPKPVITTSKPCLWQCLAYRLIRLGTIHFIQWAIESSSTCSMVKCLISNARHSVLTRTFPWPTITQSFFLTAISYYQYFFKINISAISIFKKNDIISIYLDIINAVLTWSNRLVVPKDIKSISTCNMGRNDLQFTAL